MKSKNILEIRPPQKPIDRLAAKAQGVYLSHAKRGFPKGMKNWEGVKDANINWRVNRELQLNPWRERAKAEGISLSQLGEIGFAMACQTEIGALRALLGLDSDPEAEGVRSK